MCAAPKKPSYHHGDLKRALTEAALALVVEKGPKGFTLTEAARRAGVSLAAPYRHFADKADLLASVAEQGFLELHRALGAAGESMSGPRERLIAMGRAYVGWAVANPDYYQVMFGAETKKKADYPALLAAGAQAFDNLLDAVGRCLAAGVMRGDDPLQAAGPLWAMVHGVASLAIDGDLDHVGVDERPEDLVERATNELFDGLAP
jgi:AcrR family transcriptional regulator